MPIGEPFVRKMSFVVRAEDGARRVMQLGNSKGSSRGARLKTRDHVGHQAGNEANQRSSNWPIAARRLIVVIDEDLGLDFLHSIMAKSHISP